LQGAARELQGVKSMQNWGNEQRARAIGVISRLSITRITVAMAKAYWISTYRSIHDPQALAAYAKLAGPALQAGGGRFLARGMPAQVYENGLVQRTVLIEFESVAKAIAAHDSPAYQEALRALGNGADRDLRIIEGAE
jgi:uncharacterized protein (DUF1330 family)